MAKSSMWSKSILKISHDITMNCVSFQRPRRVSRSLRNANRLIVLDRGNLVELGSHDELMAREGHYYQLYRAQARNADEAADSPPYGDGENAGNSEGDDE